MDPTLLEFTHAIIGRPTPVIRVTEKIDLNTAKQQLKCLSRLFKELNINVIELEYFGSFPANVLVEDAAVVCKGVGLMTKPTNKVEETKVKMVRGVLHQLGHKTILMTDDRAKLAAGDVLFTGREFFVGICDTSNELGARTVANAFPEFPCTALKMPKDAGHLKKYITMAGPDILCVGTSKESKEILMKIERGASHVYQTLTVPEDEAANCLFVNGTLIHRAIEEIPQSFKVFCEKIDFSRRSILFSELSKVSHGLSATCVLLRKP